MVRTRPVLSRVAGISDRQRIFVKEYCVDFNITRAARAAGYAKSSASNTGTSLLRKKEIQIAIRDELQQRLDRIEISQDMVITELAKIAFSDMKFFARWNNNRVELLDSSELPEGTTACISEISETTRGLRIKLHDKRAALELLGRHLGLFTDKLEISGKVTHSNEHRYHIIQELIQQPDIVERIKENFRSRAGAIPGDDRL